MPRKKKGPKRSKRNAPRWSLPSLSDEHGRALIRVTGKSVLLLLVAAAAVVGTVRLEARVRQDMLRSNVVPQVRFVDMPDSLASYVESDLRSAVAGLIEPDWLDDRLCRDMAQSLERTGWLSRINHVRRSGAAVFEVSAQYRVPLAMVQRENDFLLTDGDAVRLPGVYLFDPRWKLIQGVRQPVPAPGERWTDPGLPAALAIVRALSAEPFGHQITGVIVENIGGRVDRTESHIQLATDRAGGRIHWGSAPGNELAENTMAQKLAILRENHRQTGRVDAHHAVIDVTTFPDRFTIPG